MTAQQEIENESLQKLFYEIEAENQDLIIVGENSEKEMVALESIPKNEDPQLPKNSNPVLHNSIFQNSLPKIVTFSLGQKGCHFFGCHYYEWALYNIFGQYKLYASNYVH